VSEDELLGPQNPVVIVPLVTGQITSVQKAVYLTALNRAYAFDAKTGALTHTLVSPNTQADGLFGYSVALSGGVVVVGALGETVSGNSEAGRVYVF
jgi:hypothetical protein